MTRVIDVAGPRMLLLSNYAALGLGLVSAPLVARGLGVETRGDYAIILSLGPIVSIISGLGVPWGARSSLRHSGHAPMDAMPAARIVGRSMVVPCGLLGLYVTSALVSQQIGVLIAGTVFFASCGLVVMRATYGSVLLLEGQLKRLAMFGFLPAVVNVVGTLFLYAADRVTLPAVLLVNSFALVSQSFLIPKVTSGLSSIHLPVMLRLGASMWPLQISEVAFLRSDQLIVVLICGSRLGGLYAVCAIGVQLSFGLALSVGAPIFHGVDHAERRKFAQRSLKTMLALLIVLWFFVFFGGKLLIPLFFGRDFTRSIDYLPVAMLSGFSLALVFVTLQLTVANGDRIGRTNWWSCLVPLLALGIAWASGAHSVIVVVSIVAITQGAWAISVLLTKHKLSPVGLIPDFVSAWRFVKGA